MSLAIYTKSDRCPHVFKLRGVMEEDFLEAAKERALRDAQRAIRDEEQPCQWCSAWLVLYEGSCRSPVTELPEDRIVYEHHEPQVRATKLRRRALAAA